MLDLVFDMETADPDDVFTLCFLATHPRVNLRAVTVTPGTRAQIGVVRHLLGRLDVSVPIGSKKVDHPKDCVSEFHYRWLGDVGPAEPDDLGGAVIARAAEAHAGLVVVNGASLGNLAAASLLFASPLARAVIQGGFAGDSVVPEEHRLAKFAGRETCPTFNLGGDVPAAKHVVATDMIAQKFFVSKNVCHGIVYDRAMHERVLRVERPTRGFALMRDGMAHYLRKTPSGKAFHDPLAACCAIDPSACEFREVELYREKGEWGSRLASGTRTFISIACDRPRFEAILAES